VEELGKTMKCPITSSGIAKTIGTHVRCVTNPLVLKSRGSKLLIPNFTNRHNSPTFFMISQLHTTLPPRPTKIMFTVKGAISSTE